MRISGYNDQGLPPESIQHLDLAEISLSASPDELRMIADFLVVAADRMEQMGPRYSHMHLSDQQMGFDDSPHFVVFNSSNGGKP